MTGLDEQTIADDRPSQMAAAGILPEEVPNYRVLTYATPARLTLRRIENPLSSDSARYLRRWADDVRAEFRRAAARRGFFQFVEVA